MAAEKDEGVATKLVSEPDGDGTIVYSVKYGESDFAVLFR